MAYFQGRSSIADEHLQLAVTLVGDRPPSPSKASVLASVARFRMVAHNNEAAIDVGREAIEMAENLRLDEIRVQALISVGRARYESGDDEGRGEIERAIGLALESNHIAAAARGYMNLGGATNDVLRKLELVKASEDLYLRLGDVEGVRYCQARRACRLFSVGRWDEALPLMDAFIADCDAGHPHQQEAMVRIARAWVRLARDDADGAIDDVERSLAAARSAQDEAFEVLGDAAYVYVKLDRLDEARELARELVAANPRTLGRSLGVLLAADRLDMGDDVRRAFADDRHKGRRDALFVAASEQRLVDAAEIAASRNETDVAVLLRVAAAEALLEDGCMAEASAQLEPALDFYRSVGGTRFIREIEALLAEMNPAAERQPQAMPRGS